MSFGQDYARSYDTLYRSKDYPAESRFVIDRLRPVLGEKPLAILDIGCGTGFHDVELAQAGHDVTGADMSSGMLARAGERRSVLPIELQSRLRFLHGDARNLRTGTIFDAVISLFHVMSYMANVGDFDAALATARAHLNPGGALLFDFWYGPAVIADPPQRRVREIEEAGKHIRRVTEPFWDKSRNQVRITFEVTESDPSGSHATRSIEEHVMRYFFDHDVERSLLAAGFEIVEFREWLTGAEPNEKSFGVYVLARAK